MRMTVSIHNEAVEPTQALDQGPQGFHIEVFGNQWGRG